MQVVYPVLYIWCVLINMHALVDLLPTCYYALMHCRHCQIQRPLTPWNYAVMF